MQFVRFESKGGNPWGYAIFVDECDNRHEMDQRALSDWISTKFCVSRGLDTSVERATLAEMTRVRSLTELRPIGGGV